MLSIARQFTVRANTQLWSSESKGQLCHTEHRLSVNSRSIPHRDGPVAGIVPNQDPQLVNSNSEAGDTRGHVAIPVLAHCTMHHITLVVADNVVRWIPVWKARSAIVGRARIVFHVFVT